MGLWGFKKEYCGVSLKALRLYLDWGLSGDFLNRLVKAINRLVKPVLQFALPRILNIKRK